MKPLTILSFAVAPILPAVLLVGCCSQPPVDSGLGKSAQTDVTIHHTMNSHPEPTEIPPACSPAWNSLVDSRLEITDASGHGPDIGSPEWMDAVGRRSGVVDNQGHGPDPGSEEWCGAVDFKVFGRR